MKIQFYFSVFHLVYFFCIMIALAHMDMDHSSEKKKYSTKWKTEKVVLIKKKYGKIWSILDGTFHWAQTLKLGGMKIVIGTSFIKRSCGVYFHVTFRIWHGLLNIKGTTRTSSYVVYLLEKKIVGRSVKNLFILCYQYSYVVVHAIFLHL